MISFISDCSTVDVDDTDVNNLMPSSLQTGEQITELCTEVSSPEIEIHNMIG